MKLNPWAHIILSGLIIAGAGIWHAYSWIQLQNQDKVPTGQLSGKSLDENKPLFEITLFPKTKRVKNPDGTYTSLPTPYPPPLLEYIFMIRDKNKESSYVQDFRLNFYFPYKINEVISQATLFDGTGANVSGMQMFSDNLKGKKQLYTEQQTDSTLTRSISMDIETYDLNGKVYNSNIASIACAKWPKDVGFSARIIVDTSKPIKSVKMPDKLNSYNGKYFYEINGKVYEDKISGEIPMSAN